MALIVEDGTGKVDADSYVSLSDFKTYCGARALDISAYTDPELEASLRNATLYLDSAYRFRGTKSTAEQALEFPRATGTVDRDGLVVASVPSRLKWAECELAVTAAEGDLLPAATAGIKSESVGPISVTYTDDGVASQPVYPKITNLLRPLTRLDAMPPTPVSMGPTSEPFFGVDLHEPYSGLVPGATEDDSNNTLA